MKNNRIETKSNKSNKSDTSTKDLIRELVKKDLQAVTGQQVVCIRGCNAQA